MSPYLQLFTGHDRCGLGGVACRLVLKREIAYFLVSVGVGVKYDDKRLVEVFYGHNLGVVAYALGVDLVFKTHIFQSEVTVGVGNHDAALLGNVDYGSRNGVAVRVGDTSLQFDAVYAP